MSTQAGVIFLFGAGASVDAGIPDTYTFVKAFQDFIKQEYPALLEPLLQIINTCEKTNSKDQKTNKVDVEQLLGILRRLTSRENDLLLAFYEPKNFCLKWGEADFFKLQTLLEDFIREQVIAKEDDLTYLQELLNFDTPLEIFSTNYDTCIEQISYRNHRRYTDGFDINWNPKIFENDYDVKHYKMHGSIIWYENAKTKECIKIPVRALFTDKQPGHLKTIYEEDVKPLLIYPSQKSEYIEPLTDLQLMFKERLFDKEKTQFLVIVGYSFRDKYILHMIWDAARINDKLHVILISPDAGESYENNLKYIDKEAKSRISDRVIPLPYPFKTIISELKNDYLKNINQVLTRESGIIKEERNGQDMNWNWGKLLGEAIQCEYLTKAEKIFGKLKVDWRQLNFGGQEPQAGLHYGVKGLLTSAALNDGTTDRWVERVNKSLEIFEMSCLNVSYSSYGPSFQFNLKNGKSLSFKEVNRDWMGRVIIDISHKKELLTEKYLEKLSPIHNKLDILAEFFFYTSKECSWKEYFELRNKVEGIQQLQQVFSSQYGIDVGQASEFALKVEKAFFMKTFGVVLKI